MAEEIGFTVCPEDEQTWIPISQWQKIIPESRGLKNSIFFPRIVKFNGNEQLDGMEIPGSLNACTA